MMRLVIALTAAVLSTGALAQVGQSIKEAGQATAEKSEQIGDQVKGAMSSQPDKTLDKAKAKVHKAKAKAHATAAKDDARAATGK